MIKTYQSYGRDHKSFHKVDFSNWFVLRIYSLDHCCLKDAGGKRPRKCTRTRVGDGHCELKAQWKGT